MPVRVNISRGSSIARESIQYQATALKASQFLHGYRGFAHGLQGLAVEMAVGNHVVRTLKAAQGPPCSRTEYAVHLANVITQQGEISLQTLYLGARHRFAIGVGRTR